MKVPLYSSLFSRLGKMPLWRIFAFLSIVGITIIGLLIRLSYKFEKYEQYQFLWPVLILISLVLVGSLFFGLIKKTKK